MKILCAYYGEIFENVLYTLERRIVSKFNMNLPQNVSNWVVHNASAFCKVAL